MVYVFIDVIAQKFAKLDAMFQNHALLDLIGMFYSRYSMQEGANESFIRHIEVIKLCYCEVYGVETGEVLKTIPAFLNQWDLDAQQGLFKLCKKSNCDVAMVSPYSTNLITHLWKMVTNN